MPEIDRGVVEELSRFFAPAYVREEVERLRGWQQQLQLDTSFGRVISSPTWISGVSIQNNTVDAQKLNVGELKAITAYTGHLMVSGKGGNNAGGSLIVAANLSEPLKSSITIRAAADESNQAGITLRNSSGTKTVEMKLDGSGTIGAGPAITWDTAGNVTIPVDLLAGGLTITNVSSGRIGGNYDLHPADKNTSNSNFIRLDPNNGIGIFGPTEEINWNNARTHLKLDGSAVFTSNVTIKSGTNATLDASPDTGIRMLGSGGAELFKLDVNGNLRIRSARVGDNGGQTGQRIEIDSTGIAGYSGTSQITFRLGTDGSGYIKAGNASNYAIGWANDSVTINASSITAGTITADRISGGTLGGSFATGANAIDGSNANGGFKATSDDSATFRNGKLTIVAVNPNVRIVGSIYSFIGGLYISAVSSVSTTYSYISLKGGGTIDNPSWSGPELYLKYDSATQNWATLQTGSMKLYCGAEGNGSEGSFFIALPDSNGTSKLQISRPNLTLLALASDGSLYYRGLTTTAGPGAYKGAIQATVRIDGQELSVKIPCYE